MYKITKADKIETDKIIEEFLERKEKRRQRLIKLQAIMMGSIAKKLSMEDTFKQGKGLLKMGYSIEEMEQTLEKIRAGTRWK